MPRLSEQLIERTNALKIIQYECIIDGKRALYNLPNLNYQFGGDVNLCSSCLKKYDKGQIKIERKKIICMC